MTAAAHSLPLSSRFALRPSWPLLIGALFFAFLIRRPELLNDPDIYWHLRVGAWILDNHAVPRVDHWTFTMLGAPWVAHEWLAEALYAIAYRAGGWTAVVVLASGAFAASLAILTRYLLRYLEPLYAVATVALAFSLLAAHLVARPHTLIAPIIVLWGIGLLDAREESRGPSLWLIGLMLIWANLHGSFVFGLALLVPFALDAVLGPDAASRFKAFKQWVIPGMGCALAAMLTPSGPSGLFFALSVNEMNFALGQIGEWRSPNFQVFQPLELCILLVAAAAFKHGLRLSWLRIAVLLGLLHMALKHARHADLLALLGPLVLARPVAEQWFTKRAAESAPSALDRLFRSFAQPATGLCTTMAIVALTAVAIVAIRADRLLPSPAITPATALRVIQTHGLSGRGLNSYDFGGYLIFQDVPTYVDSRADLFGDRFLSEYFSAINLTAEGGLQALLERHSIQWTMLPPGVAAVQLLDHLPGWKRLHTSSAAVVHIRER